MGCKLEDGLCRPMSGIAPFWPLGADEGGTDLHQAASSLLMPVAYPYNQVNLLKSQNLCKRKNLSLSEHKRKDLFLMQMRSNG